MNLDILNVSNLSFSYGKKNILSNVTFKIDKGEMVSILGGNGSGKTTLLKCIMNFLKSERGSCSFFGKNVKDYSERELFKKISYVPQVKYSNYPNTVFETVLLGRSAHLDIFEKPDEKDISMVEEVLKKMGLSDLSTKKCNELSGGEFQLVLIARAICNNPELIILDEPESSLDLKNQLMVMKTLVNLNKEGTACLFNTHDPMHALNYTHKCLLLFADKKSVYGDVKEVITEENLKKTFNTDIAIREVLVNGKTFNSIISFDL